MNKRSTNFIVLFLIVVFSYVQSSSIAQTPLTDIIFWKPYSKDFPFVQLAADTGIITDEIAKYLMDNKVSNDLKAAIINALSFDFEEKHNATEYLLRLKAIHHLPLEAYLPLDSMNATELMCYGYLKVMDNYFEYQKCIPIIEMALKKEPLDCSINLIMSVLTAQQVYLDNRCEAVTKLLLFENSYDFFRSPFLKDARSDIKKYIKKQEKLCNRK